MVFPRCRWSLMCRLSKVLVTSSAPESGVMLASDIGGFSPKTRRPPTRPCRWLREGEATLTYGHLTILSFHIAVALQCSHIDHASAAVRRIEQWPTDTTTSTTTTATVPITITISTTNVTKWRGSPIKRARHQISAINWPLTTLERFLLPDVVIT